MTNQIEPVSEDILKQFAANEKVKPESLKGYPMQRMATELLAARAEITRLTALLEDAPKWKKGFVCIIWSINGNKKVERTDSNTSFFGEDSEPCDDISDAHILPFEEEDKTKGAAESIRIMREDLQALNPNTDIVPVRYIDRIVQLIKGDSDEKRP